MVFEAGRVGTITVDVYRSNWFFEVKHAFVFVGAVLGTCPGINGSDHAEKLLHHYISQPAAQ
jgi:hypothetical protein